MSTHIRNKQSYQDNNNIFDLLEFNNRLIINAKTESSKISKYQKELFCNRQKRFRDKKDKNNTLFTIIDSEELECLLITEIPTIVIEPLYTNPDLINIYPNRRPYPSHIKTLCHDMGRMDQICRHCKAKFWMLEKDQNSGLASPRFLVCYTNSKVKLSPLFQPPPCLLELYTSNTLFASKFRKNIRAYNTVLACTSFGSNVDQQFLEQGVSNFHIHGQNYHLISPLLSKEGNPSAFAQIYIYDTAHEVENLKDIIQEDSAATILMIIHGHRTHDICRYNALTSSEVAAIMRISEFHPSYDPLYYVLLFPRGDDGWHINIPLIGAVKRERDKPQSTDDYDAIVLAEIPNITLNPLAYETVLAMMMHSLYSSLNPNVPCMKNGHQHISFQDREDLQDIINCANNQMTTLTAWFQENINNPTAYSTITIAIEQEALTLLNNLLLLNGKSLKDFPNMPIPPENSSNVYNDEDALN
ncbi:9249_t:CDS:2 [Dentiscutata erythropus]|uniref:9249_t:CDS:1 n=1 Tax=Dentiscutata erythropus TaxID=1348616 RepID=A0A9N9EPJ2_9GLOM|nr:9249_t:CDS:2 [Dentiscutata erythropus]